MDKVTELKCSLQPSPVEMKFGDGSEIKVHYVELVKAEQALDELNEYHVDDCNKCFAEKQEQLEAKDKEIRELKDRVDGLYDQIDSGASELRDTREELNDRRQR